MDQMQFEAAMKTVISALQAAGYDPYSQLLGYVGTGNRHILLGKAEPENWLNVLIWTGSKAFSGRIARYRTRIKLV